MNRKTLITIILVAIVGIAIGVYLWQQTMKPPSPPTPTPTPTPTPSPTPTPTPTATPTPTPTPSPTPTPTPTPTPSPSPTPPSTEIVLKVITRHGADITLTSEQLFLESEYAKKYNIVDIRWLPVGSTLWIDTIRKSGDIDVGWGGGPTLFDTVHREELLAPLTSEEVTEALEEIPDQIVGVQLKKYDEENVFWVGAAISSFGFTINKQYLVDNDLPEPSKWADLASETYSVTLPSPSIGTADALYSTSNTRMFEIILQGFGWKEGWKLLTLMGANAKIFDRSESVRDAAIRGEIGAGTTIDFYGYTAQLQNPGIAKYVLPKDGTIVNPDPVALLTTSTHKEAAQAFIAWVISVEGQKVWLDPEINRMPINPKIFDAPEGKERPDLKDIYERTLESVVIDFSDDLAISYEYSLMHFYHRTIADPWLKLHDVWMQLANAKLNGKISQAEFEELTNKLSDPLLFDFTDPSTGQQVTFTQEYAQGINDKLVTDPDFKDELWSEWLRAAEARYDSVLQELTRLVG